MSRTLVLIRCSCSPSRRRRLGRGRQEAAARRYQTGYDLWRALRRLATGRSRVRAVAPDGSLTLAASGLASGTMTRPARTTAATTTTAAAIRSAKRSRLRPHRFRLHRGDRLLERGHAGRHAGSRRWIRAHDRRPLDEVVQPRRLGVRQTDVSATRSSSRATPTVRRGRHTRPEREEGAAGGRLPDEAPSLHRERGGAERALRLGGAVSTAARAEPTHARGRAQGRAGTRSLDLPEHSQMVYPDGGNVWCSPTSSRWCWRTGTGNPGTIESRVRSTVEGVYDWLYDGHGNWPFNTAFAATRAWRPR